MKSTTVRLLVSTLFPAQVARPQTAASVQTDDASFDRTANEELAAMRARAGKVIRRWEIVSLLLNGW